MGKKIRDVPGSPLQGLERLKKLFRGHLSKRTAEVFAMLIQRQGIAGFAEFSSISELTILHFRPLPGYKHLVELKFLLVHRIS